MENMNPTNGDKTAGCPPAKDWRAGKQDTEKRLKNKNPTPDKELTELVGFIEEKHGKVN